MFIHCFNDEHCVTQTKTNKTNKPIQFNSTQLTPWSRSISFGTVWWTSTPNTSTLTDQTHRLCSSFSIVCVYSLLSFIVDVNGYYNVCYNSLFTHTHKYSHIASTVNHSFIVANIIFKLFKQNPRKDANGETQFPLVAGVLMMLVTGLGGAIINAVLLGEQQVFLSQDILLAYFLLAWALTIYSPFYVVHYLTGNVVVEVR